MPRTKTTVRHAPPSRDDVARALVVASVEFTHPLAPVTPVLSPARCRFLCDWILRASGADSFARPVPWEALGLHDYPQFVQYPMDLGQCRRYTNDDAFDFAGFLDCVRLVWSNACRYNPPGQAVHEAARRLAALFDAKVIEMQRNAADDDSPTLQRVYAPLVLALRDRPTAEPFVRPVDVAQEPAYPHYVSVPTALDDILRGLDASSYVNRHDVASDVRRVWTNAQAYCPPEHWIHRAAVDLGVIAERMLVARHDDVDSKYLVHAQMRAQLFENLCDLDDADRLAAVAEIGLITPDAVVDLGDGTSYVCVDTLSQRQFVVADVAVRRLLVARRSAQDSSAIA